MVRQLKRLLILILPLSYYFLNRNSFLLLNTVIIAIVLFIAYKKYRQKIKMPYEFLNNIFFPEKEFSFLLCACFLSGFLFHKLIAIDIMLFVILGNTFANMAKERYGKIIEIVVFLYVCLACSLFILFFPLVFEWHIVLFGCFTGALIRLLKFPVNQDLSIAFASGIVMNLFLV